MTDDEINIRIAEWCGGKWYWRVCGRNTAQTAFVFEPWLAWPPEEGIGKAWKGCAGETRLATPDEISTAKKTGQYKTAIENYSTDLNAIRAAQGKLGGKLHGYWAELWKICEPTLDFAQTRTHWDYADFDNIGRATAHQCAEALLKVIDAERQDATP